MTLSTSQNGINLIKSFEGCRLTAYKAVSTETYYTIGYGHYGSDVTAGMTITQEEAEELLKSDLVKYENYVNAKNLDLNQNMFDALVSFTYNCGSGSLSTLVKNRTLLEIAEALLLYNKSGGSVLAGLTTRRKKERVLFLTPIETLEMNSSDLPFNVMTTTTLNVRTGAGMTNSIIRTTEANEVLKVWAIETNGETKWGKNGSEYFSLSYCTRLEI